MRLNPSLAYVFGILLLLGACHSQNERPTFKDAELNKIAWLSGTWQDASSGGISQEIWKKTDEQTLGGFSYFLVGKDTASSETMKITKKDQHLIYTATVKDQNNGQPVEFTMTSNDSSQLVFENPMHDFPKKIVYKKITNDSVMIQLEGVVDSSHEVQEYPLKRMKG